MANMRKKVMATLMTIIMLPITSGSVTAKNTEPELLVNESFNEYVTDSKPNNLDIAARYWSISDYKDGEKGIIASTDGIQTHIRFAIPATKNVVMSFDIMATDATPTADFIVTDSNGQSQTLLSFVSGEEAKAYNNIPVSSFDKTRFTNYAIVYRTDSKDYDIYVNGSLKVNKLKVNDAKIEDISSFELLFDFGIEGHKVIVDNVNAYEGDTHTVKKFPKAVYNYTEKEPEKNKDENNLRVIDITKEQGIFEDKDGYADMLKGYIGIHSTSGVVYVNDKKELLRNTPIKKDTNDFMLPVAELGEILGVGVDENGTTATFNGVTVTGEIYDGILYVNDDDLINALGKVVTKVPSTYNANMVILGEKEFILPDTQEEIDLLNDYLLYYRPTSEQFTELYNESPLAGVHPRIQFTQADFDRMVELTKTDDNMKKWKEQVILAADGIVLSDLPKHNLYDGLRMDCQRKLSKDIHALTVAYYITKDQRYLDRAYAELEAVSTFPDWNPFHHLDTCEMMAAVSVGYDWLYNFFTPEQRAVIENGMMKNGLYDSYLGMLSEGSLMRFAFYVTNNHGTVDNAGLLMASLAFMDVYPKECAWLGANSLRGMEENIYRWAPEGVWYEGAGYWELTMQFTAKWLDTLETYFVTDLGMGNLEGMDMAAMAELQSQSPIAIYNFADAIEQSIYVPEMFYLANRYNTAGVYKAVIDGLKGNWTDNEDVGLGMLWYDPAMNTEGETLGLDYMMESIDTLLMRDTWDSQEPTFVGIHAGKTILEHSQLDGGSFIYENSGVRWAVDPGMGDYNSLGYFESDVGGNRWIHLRNRAEGHNTIITSPEGKHEDHKIFSFADQTIVMQKPKGVISKVDMTELLYDVSEATRGFAFTDNRQSLVVRDELSLTKETDVYWFMQSKATGEIDGNSIILSQNGVAVKVEWTASAPIEATYEPISALPTSPQQLDKWNGSGIRRLALKMTTDGDADITVKITPVTLRGASTLADWDKPIEQWEIPDGELPEKPVLDSIWVGDRKIEAGKVSNITYMVVEEEFNIPPEISVKSDKYDIEIIQAKNFGDTATITVTDKNDPINTRTYNVVCEIIKKPIEIEGKVSIPVRDFEVSEIPQPENAPINMFDNDRSTRWSAEGYGQWIKLDLGSVQKVNEVAMSFMSGHTRQTKLTFAISDDGENWTQLKETLSSGKTEELEFFDIGDVSARYIKIGCNGNTSTAAESWNSVTEIVVTRNK